MLLNHLPITFSSKEFTGYSVAYESAVQLKKLRKDLYQSHFCLRSGFEVLLFPYDKHEPNLGTPKAFDIADDHSIANALAGQALLRSFFKNNRKISGTRPVSCVRDTQNLLSLGHEYFAIYPEYSFDVRPLAPQEAEFIDGVVVNFHARVIIRPNAAALHKRGVQLKGLYLIGDKEESDNPYILPMFDRHLLGRVSSIQNGLALLDDARVESIELDKAFIDANPGSIERIGRELLGKDYQQFIRVYLGCLYEISGAEKQLDRLEKLLSSFKDLQGELPCCNGLSISLSGQLTEVSPGIGVGLSRKLSTPACSLRPGGSITVQWPADIQVSRNGPFDSDSFDNKKSKVAVIFPKEHLGHIESFVAKLRDGVPSNGGKPVFEQGFIRKYRLQSAEFILYPVTANSSEKARGYRDASIEAAKSNPHAALVLLLDKDKQLARDDSPYYVSKATLMSQGIPAQVVKLETVLQKGVVYSLNNIALALYAKLGGIPWTLAVQQRLTHEVIVGIGSARIGFDRLSERDRLVGITTVFSGDGNYLLGNATKEATSDNYKQVLLDSLRENIAELKRRFGWQPSDKLRLIFHQSYKRYKNEEAEAVKELISDLKEFEIEFAFVHVSEDHGWKMFDTSSSGARTWDGKVKGSKVPERGYLVPLGPYAALVTLVGPSQLKTDLQGCPKPILVSIHRDSTFQSLDYVAKQVFDLTFMSWRSTAPSTRPVSILYSGLIVDLLGHLKGLPNWNPDILLTRLRESRWFL